MSSDPLLGEATLEGGRYRKIAKLGQGGMANVNLVLSSGPSRVKKLLVSKELLPDLKEDANFLTMFLDEARIALRLNHPNLIQTYEVSSEGEHPRIVMEYLEGQTLATLLHRVGRTKVPLSLHLHVIAEVLTGLHHAHEVSDFDGTPLGIVHRDVSPHNVFLTYNGEVKLVDFGIAKAANTDRTRTGVWKGKANYAAAEQMVCAPVDRRTDVFSVGIMLWEALAERRMAAELPEVAVMQRRVAGQDPKLLTVAPDAPPELARICDKATAHLPDERYASAEEMRMDLVTYLETTKRRGARELAELVSTSFAAERAKMRQHIDVRVKEIARKEHDDTDIPVSLADPAAAVPETADMSSLGTQTRAALASSPEVDAPVETRTNLRLLLGLGAAAVVVVVVAGFVVARYRQPPVDGSLGASPSAVTSVTSDAEMQVDVSITASPASASMFLDDVPIGPSPYHAKLPRSSKGRLLRVVASGFVTEERSLTFEAEARIEVDLKPVAPSVSDAFPRVAPRGGTFLPHATVPRKGTGKTLVAPVATTSSPATPTATPPAAPPAPGEALVPAQKRSRSIDDKF